jgi:oligopeptide transport system substrate-binding protein
MPAAPRMLIALLCAPLWLACGNNPYGEFPAGRVFFTSMEETPTTLDPGRVQDMDSAYIASNIHDAPYSYHYLQRPLRPIPAMATALPVIGQTRRDGRVYYSLRFSIKRNLRYADDECFPDGRGRAITIDDIIFPIKRAADDAIQPFGKPFFEGALLGFDEFNAELARARVLRSEAPPQTLADDPLYKAYQRDLPGVVRVDDYTLELLFQKPAPQSFFFFAMPSSSPALPVRFA